MIAAGIHDNAGEPGREFGLALEAADLLDQRAADVLRAVSRMRARSGHPPGDAVNAIVVPTQQGLERIAIAARGTVDEIAIGVERGAIATGAGARTGQLRGRPDRSQLDRRTLAALQGIILSLGAAHLRDRGPNPQASCAG